MAKPVNNDNVNTAIYQNLFINKTYFSINPSWWQFSCDMPFKKYIYYKNVVNIMSRGSSYFDRIVE